MKYKILLTSFFIMYTISAWATIVSVNTVPAPTDTLSNGKAYYVAGKQYTFRIFASDPDIALRTGWGTLTLQFYQGAALQQSCQINIATDGIISQTGVIVDTVNYVSAGNSNIEYQVTLRFRWDSAPFNASAANSVMATVTSLVPGFNSQFNTATFNYGIITNFTVMNFIQDGDAADGRINPWHTAFNVTGTLVYFMAGEIITNSIESLDAGEVSSAVLFRNGVSFGIADSGAPPNVLYAIPANRFRTFLGGTDAIPAALGNHTWDVRATMNTGGITKTSNSTLGLNCNKIQVTGITFVNGGGINAPYYRSLNIPTTEIVVTAQMQSGGTAMVGNTFIVVNDGIGNNYTVQILNGQTTGQLLISPLPGVGAGTTALTYTPSRVYGGAYDGASAGVVGQDVAAKIVGATQVINWDNNDPPGSSSPFVTEILPPASTAQSLTLNWVPLANAFPDQDFYTYRIYFRKTGATTWTILDRTVADYGPTGTYRLDLIGTGSVSITGLFPLTSYEYYISALDVFGNEVTSANTVHSAAAPGTISTTASSITISITDGITTYNDAAFNKNPDPANIKLRKTAIKIKADIVTAGTTPDSVFLVLADNDSDVSVSNIPVIGKNQYGLAAAGGGPGTVDDLSSPVMASSINEIAFLKISGNIWEAYIPSEHPLMSVGKKLRFILKLHFLTGDSYVDHNSEDDIGPPGYPNDEEWRFSVTGNTIFIPWPTRVLNNVITDNNPVAYPAYYLTDDASVTIIVYDIKGRIVSTLLKDAYRKAGENIKENGWSGTNKSNRKVGIGLYYIHIKAVRYLDGKTIIDKFNKVVMAR